MTETCGANRTLLKKNMDQIGLIWCDMRVICVPYGVTFKKFSVALFFSMEIYSRNQNIEECFNSQF